MTEKLDTFTASNGLEAEKEGDNILVRYPDWDDPIRVAPPLSDALREYFQHERDKQLGRVRWPEDTDYVIYRDETADDLDGRRLYVFDESAGDLYFYWEKTMNLISETTPSKAARWWFENNPEPKPWHDAQEGEVWVLTIDGEEKAALVDRDRDFRTIAIPFLFFKPTNPKITAGRRIWPND